MMRDVDGALDAARQFIRKKKKLMSMKVADSFVKNIYLALIGVKDAYMFESFSCPEQVGLELVDRMRQNFGVQERVLLLCLHTGDYIVTLERIFRKKSEEISEICSVPVVVDVSSAAEPLLCSSDQCAAVWRGVAELAVHITSTCATTASETVSVPVPFDEIAGPVLFAGWCLGYPFLYHYLPEEAAGGVGCRALSMQVLAKVCMQVDIEGTTISSHPFLEFTVPRSTLAMYSNRQSSCDCTLDRLLTAAVSDKVSALLPDSASGDIINIHYDVTDFQIPHVML